MHEVYDENFELYLKKHAEGVEVFLVYLFMLFFGFLFFLSSHTKTLTNEIVELNRMLKISQQINIQHFKDSSTESESSSDSDDSEEEFKCGGEKYVYSNHSN